VAGGGNGGSGLDGAAGNGAKSTDSFGLGVSSVYGGGGGGWFGGEADWNRKNSPSCGFVYTVSTKNEYPSGCLLSSAFLLTNAEVISGTNQFPAPGGGTETGHSGNGYARITLVE